MQLSLNRRRLFYFTYFILICYLLIKTPLVSDDYAYILKARSSNLLLPSGWFVAAPLEHYFLNIWYNFFNLENMWLVNIIKIFYVIVCFYLITRFFSIFVDESYAFLISFLFIFYPSHDSTVFWYLGIYMLLTISLYLFSYYLVHNDRLILGLLFAFIASFTSYVSVAIAIMLVALFLFERKPFKALLIFIPNILFSIYYIYTTKIVGLTKTQIPQNFNIFIIFKQFILQIITFFDALLGLSIWLKIYFSILELSWMSIIIGILIVILFHYSYKNNASFYNLNLIKSLIILSFFSLFIFAVTGRYPQTAFNLGNRVTIFGSLLITYLFVLLPVKKTIKTLIFSILIFSLLGLSDHWKKWNIRQNNIIKNIKNNESLKNYDMKKEIFVCGNQYSKLGPFSHIEFLSEDWVPKSIFGLALGKDINAHSLNKRHEFQNGFIVDNKYMQKIKLSDSINVYDSETNQLFTLEPQEINLFLSRLPKEYRHWVQFLNIKFINSTIVKLMPRFLFYFDKLNLT